MMAIILCGWIDATCLRWNDFFLSGALVSSAVQILDVVSDIFFALSLRQEHVALLVCAVAFIAFPSLLTLYQLHREIQRKWRGHDELELWLTDYTRWLLVLSVGCGSSFTALQISRSNLFELPVFDIPLSKVQMNSFRNKELYSTVLLEVHMYAPGVNVDSVANDVLSSLRMFHNCCCSCTFC